MTTIEQRSFASGEISPLLHARSDYSRHQTGTAKMVGFLPLRQGGFTRAPGTLWRGRTKGDAAGRLVSFEFAADDAVVLEFTPLVMRVWRYGVLVLSEGVPFELATPWDADAIRRLRWEQNGDLIYFVDGVLPPQQLSRFALDSWSLAPIAFTNGPFADENEDETLTIEASAETGTVTLTASAAFFVAGMVGEAMQFRVVDESTPSWTGNTTVALGDRILIDGRYYAAAGAGNTGPTIPIHTEGTRSAGQDYISWTYLTGTIGIVTIIAVASGTSATATVTKRLPPGISEEGTFRWSRAAWTPERGYPACVRMYDRRLVFAATTVAPRQLWFSVLEDFTNFEPEDSSGDLAFSYAIAGTGTRNRILWLEPGPRGLHIGALGEEWSSRSTTNTEIIAAVNALFRRDTRIGSADVQPISPDGRPIFVSRDRRRIFELVYSFQDDAILPKELSLPGEHLGADLFTQIVWQSAPVRLGWLRRLDGSVVVVSYDPSEEVLGWARYPLAGGICEDLVTSPDETGANDIVSMIVRRTVDGEVVRQVEEVAPFYANLLEEGSGAAAVHLFAAVSFDRETASPDIDGLDHLEGEDVHVWSEAGAFGPLTVSGGAIELDYPVATGCVGLLDNTARCRTLDLVAPSRSGETTGRIKQLKGTGLHVYRSAAGQARAVTRDLRRGEQQGAWISVIRGPLPEDLTTLYTGITDLDLKSGNAREISIEFRPIGGAPMTILAVAPPVDVEDVD